MTVVENQIFPLLYLNNTVYNIKANEVLTQSEDTKLRNPFFFYAAVLCRRKCGDKLWSMFYISWGLNCFKFVFCCSTNDLLIDPPTRLNLLCFHGAALWCCRRAVVVNMFIEAYVFVLCTQKRKKKCGGKSIVVLLWGKTEENCPGKGAKYVTKLNPLFFYWQFYWVYFILFYWVYWFYLGLLLFYWVFQIYWVYWLLCWAFIMPMMMRRYLRSVLSVCFLSIFHFYCF